MTDSPISIISTGGEKGEAMQRGVVAICQLIEAATRPYVVSSDNPVAAMSIALTACQTYAGIIAGQLICMGDLSPQDKRRGAEMAAQNFREGVEIGIKQYTRVLRETAQGRG